MKALGSDENRVSFICHHCMMLVINFMYPLIVSITFIDKDIKSRSSGVRGKVLSVAILVGGILLYVDSFCCSLFFGGKIVVVFTISHRHLYNSFLFMQSTHKK